MFKHLCKKLDRYLWGTVALIVSASVFAAGAIAYELTRPGPFEPLQGSAYEGRQSSDLVGRELVVLAGDKCNESDQFIEITGETFWRRLDVLGTNVPGFTGAGIQEPQTCRTDLFFVNPLPDEIVEGTWELVGIETARADGREQVRTWRTESFTLD